MRRWIILVGATGLGACSFPTENFHVGAAPQPDVVVVTDAPASDHPDVVVAPDLPAADVVDAPAQDDTGCAAGQAFCGGSCVDVTASMQHCGGCDRACDRTNASTAACEAGRCRLTCRDGFADCDMDARNGCETSLATTTNCGQCRNACPAPMGANRVATCAMGACATSCAQGFGDCDGNAANGCESPLDAATSCGRCGVRCRGHVGSPTNACAMGTCAPTCAAGYADCDGNPANGCESALGTNAHCTGCNMACTGLCTMSGGASMCTPNNAGSYTVTTTVGAFVDVCARSTSTKVLLGVDDGVAPATMPFAFSLWGARPFMHPLQIHSNGLLSFDPSTTSPTSGLIPDPAGPNGVVAPWWTNLRTSATTGVCHEVTGVAPNRRWIVQWREATYFSDITSTLDFEVAFIETANVIEFSYRALPQLAGGPIPTVGIESPSGVAAAAVCNPFQDRCSVAAMQTIRFTPM